MNTILDTIPTFHTIIVMVSIGIFLLRGILVLTTSSLAQAGWLLSISALATLGIFISGVIMAFAIQMPFNSGYVMTSIVGLILFVGISVLAFKPHIGKGTSLLLWLLGLIVVAYTYQVSTHNLPPLF